MRLARTIALVTHATVRIASVRSLPSCMQRLATVAPYHLRATIYDWHDPTDYWYSVVSGAARKCSLTADGRRHILEFLLPGDLFGFGAWDEQDRKSVV